MESMQGPAACRRPFFLGALLGCLALAAGLPGAFRPVGGAVAEVFGPAKAWVRTPARVYYQAQPEGLELHLLGTAPGEPLNARLQVEQVPGYAAWVAKRKAEGGAAWRALQGLLDSLEGRPLVALTHAPLRVGEAQVLLGLRKGARFELYATLACRVESRGQALVLSPGGAHFESAQARLAWEFLAPLARSQARRVAGQNP